MKKFSKLIVVSMLILLVLGIGLSGAKPVSNDLQDKVPAPSLKIEKWIDSDERVEPGQIITVYVNFTNVGTKTAYNPVVVEPQFENFSVTNIKGFDERKWVEIGPNATFSYSYQMEFVKEGTYTIESTTITYEDAEGTEYIAVSAYYRMTVTYEEPPVTKDAEWQKLFISIVLIALIPIILYLVNKYVFEGKR